MLENLYIKNFILIDELSLDFKDDFSAFIGETGAGKSIFIDCIGCLLGDKFTTSYIRKGCDKCLIEGVFSTNDEIRQTLAEAGYDNETLIVTREISQDGKSINRINQRATTVSFIKQLLTPYIDIHNQHDNQYLLNEKYHLSLLDEYCQNQTQLNQLAQLYKEYHKLQQEYDDLTNVTYNEAQIEMIEYQLNELKQLNVIDVQEDRDIETKLKQANELEKIQETLVKIKELFVDDGIIDKLYQFGKLSNNLSHFETIKVNIDNINNTYYTLSDDYQAIISTLATSDIDAQEIDELNNRLFQLQKVKRKYNTDLQGLLDKEKELTEQLENYSNKEFILNKLKKQVDEAYGKYLLVANEVSANRKTKAIDLTNQIIEQLKDLSLSKVSFNVEFSEGNNSSKGNDNVRFLVSMNMGQDLQPLAKVASGGELSRLMLGLKVIFSSLQGTKLIIFDEIDTGVSGFVSMSIGVKMSKIAKAMQVFAVTHLPAVAACSNHQYLISKNVINDETHTSVKLLNQTECIQQLAILSSTNTSDIAISAAEELYHKAQQAVQA